MNTAATRATMTTAYRFGNAQLLPDQRRLLVDGRERGSQAAQVDGEELAGDGNTNA